MQGTSKHTQILAEFLHCNVTLDCSRSPAVKLLISRKLRNTGIPLGFFINGADLENVGSAAVTVAVLKKRFQKKPFPNSDKSLDGMYP